MKSRKVGRPALSGEAMTMIGVRLPADVAARYSAEAMRRGVAPSAIVREVAIEHAPPIMPT
jgi:hypothetical protein